MFCESEMVISCRLISIVSSTSVADVSSLPPELQRLLSTMRELDERSAGKKQPPLVAMFSSVVTNTCVVYKPVE